MKILICGDSYCLPDPEYPRLHWSEKILSSSSDYEIINLAYGGCSNALISLQVLHGLRFNPDFVVFSFTDDKRYEFDLDISALPKSFDPGEIASFIKRRFTTNRHDGSMTASQKDFYKLWLTESSDSLEKLKNYFYICFCLLTVKSRNIRFCYSLGGFEFLQDYTSFLKQNHVQNLLEEFSNQELSTNLWYHGRKSRPWFHVDNDDALTLFANECMERFHG